jgi:hypothetical protein
MKKLFKAMSLFVTITVFMSFSQVAYAADQSNLPNLDINQYANPNSLISLGASDVSDNIINLFEDNGISVNGNSLVEIVPINDSYTNNFTNSMATSYLKDDYALCLTSIVGNQISSTVLIQLSQNDNGDYEVYSPSIEALTDTEASDGNYNLDKNITLLGTAYANIYYSSNPLITPFYQPCGCSVEYSKKNSSCTVNNIRATYVSSGTLYYTSDLSKAISGNSQLSATVYQSNPNQNTYYTTVATQNNGKAINISSGGPFTGNGIDFDYSVNGAVYNATCMVGF